MGTSNLTRKRIKNAQELAIYDHFLQWDSPVTFDNNIERNSKKLRNLFFASKQIISFAFISSET